MVVMFHNVPIWVWILIAIIFIAAVLIVFMLVKKQSAGIARQKAELSEEAKAKLKSVQLYPVAGKQSEWIQLAMLSVMTAKGKNYQCKLLFYNTRLPGNRLHDFEYAESRISIEDAERYGLKAGSFVYLHIMPEQCKTVILPEFCPDKNA